MAKVDTNAVEVRDANDGVDIWVMKSSGKVHGVLRFFVDNSGQVFLEHTFGNDLTILPTTVNHVASKTIEWDATD